MSSSTFKSSSTIRSSSAFRSSSTFRSSSIIGIIISSSQSSVVPTISTSKNYCLRNNSYSCEMMNVFFHSQEYISCMVLFHCLYCWSV